MRFGGLFVGLSAQEDADIVALKFAARDALALWSVFADANEADGYPETDTQLLLDEHATTEAILKALDELVERSQKAEYGLVMIHIAGHGTPDGRLVTYDTDHALLDMTALPLNRVTERVGRIRSKNIIVTFDSCFSGTVVGLEGSENASGFETAMKNLAGESRTVAWAALPAEKALESAVFGHGFFSKGLLVGLENAALRDGAHVLLAAWIDYAISFAQDHATTLGRVQTPGGRIHLAANARIPIPPQGPRQRRLKEEDGILPVGSDPADIKKYGLFDAATLDAIKTRLGGEMHPLQVDAIAPGGVLAGRNVVVRAPTSSGKTFVGELAILRAYAQRRKAIVLLPMRALVYEQWESFDRHYGALGLRSVRSCGGTDDDDDRIRGHHFDVAFLTYEKFAAMVFARPGLLDAIGVVVLDEVQLIGDESRGRTVELIIARLLRRRSRDHHIQIVALCADVGDLNHLPEWLSATPIAERSRPVPLHEGVLGPTGEFRYRESPGANPKTVKIPGFPVETKDLDRWLYDDNLRTRMAATLIRHLASEAETVLAFRSTRKLVRDLAGALKGTVGQAACKSALDGLSSLPLTSERSRAGDQLRDCLTGGVGFHIGDLDRTERETLESGFRAGEVKVMVATTTLAMGINTPARAVVIADHAFWNSTAKESVPLNVTDYRNMAGRAGRLLGPRLPGWSYLIATRESEVDELWTNYIESAGETLWSGLAALAPEDLALALLAITGRTFAKEVLQAAFGTFHGFNQRGDRGWRNSLRTTLDTAIGALETAGFVHRHSDNTLELTALGRVCGWEGLRFASAARIVSLIDEIRAKGEEFDDGTLIALAQCTDELDQVQTPMAKDEASKWTSAAKKYFETHQAVLNGLRGGDSDLWSPFFPYRMKRWYGLAMWMRGADPKEIETHYERRPEEPGMGPLRRAAERTGDILRGVCALISVREPGKRDDLAKQCGLLSARLEHGVTREASELTRLGLGIRRRESLELAKRKIVEGPSLFAAIESDDKRVYEVFGSDGVHRLKATISKRSKTNRFAVKEPDPLPDLFGENSEF